MDRERLIAQFDKLLPLAARWAEKLEARILRKGVSLLEEGLIDARALRGARTGAGPSALSRERADAG
ncbi:MAG TPA: hypothetical protein VH207_00405 [Chthoniobacterales bacterium]|jgi:hypothetical protein|nr:hypothetical protein [Chthoniobacterales bacterium]